TTATPVRRTAVDDAPPPRPTPDAVTSRPSSAPTAATSARPTDDPATTTQPINNRTFDDAAAATAELTPPPPSNWAAAPGTVPQPAAAWARPSTPRRRTGDASRGDGAERPPHRAAPEPSTTTGRRPASDEPHGAAIATTAPSTAGLVPRPPSSWTASSPAS